ncbi:inactive serine protease PAMR1 isoform X2 [Astyanax mexicanus]|uniref:Inactive serine protease PAMR1 n=1 Tax=Astyanax mexicanus TaxID=7994 RepID=A0A8B9L5R7_ASTMX|nr:inactive serine protease PAMR1 isoform X2 [Astyanax mexicanus]
MPSAARLQRQSQRPCGTLPPGSPLFLSLLILILLLPPGRAWPYDYRHLYNYCPGPEWNVMCRGCCEYDVIRCKCPLQGTPVGYAVPCCRNARNECDPCIIHPGCSIFENCKRCNNGTWGPRDNFFIKGQYCSECRPGWSGGDCMTCGGVIRKRQGHLVLESYPTNARCEWTLQVDRPFTIELKFMMLSLEFDHSCRYDFVEVRDGDSINSRVIGRFCGNERPPPIQSTGNSLHILFVSDGYKTFDGLFAIFQENSACTSSPCLHDGTCILDSSHSYHCACLAGYTGRRCEHVLECKRPPMPEHGSMESLDVRVGGQALFRCDAGFSLKGFRMSTCRLDGSWTTPTPLCVPEKNCGIPPKPAYGDHFLVYGPNDVLIALQYLCYRPYALIGTPQRTCLGNNTWSGTAPICVKEEEIIPFPDKDKDKKVEEIGKDFIDKTGQDKEKNPDITNIYIETPTSEKDKTGQVEKLGEDKGQEIGKDVGKDPGKDIGKDPGKNIDKDPSKDIDKDPGKDIGKDPGKDTDKDPGKDIDKDPGKDIGKDPGKDIGKDAGKDIGKDPGKDIGKDPGKDIGKDITTIASKDKTTGKDPDDSMNTVRKKDSDNGKHGQKYLGKDNDLEGEDNAVKDPTKDLDINTVDIVLIDDTKNLFIDGDIKETIPIIPKAPEKDKKETATDVPQFTIVSLKQDEKDNVLYTINTSGPGNNTEPVDSNDIEGDLETLLPKETVKIQPKATEDNSTVKAIVPTMSPVTKKHSVTEVTQQGGAKEETTESVSETQSREEPPVNSGAEDERRHTEKERGAENLSIVEAEGRKCPPPPRLFQGFYEYVPGLNPETVEFSCNHSYALSGNARRTCQPNGTWSGTQPFCVRACREPKVSVLVKQKALPPQVPFRKTPVHKFYSSSGFTKFFSPVSPTKGPPTLAPLPQGFHHLYTHIEYECTSPYYHHTGSARRTCLKTGKWSGRHVSCSPVCGKLPNFDPQHPVDSHWPWLAAIYRLSGQNGGGKLGKAATLAEGKGKGSALLDDDGSMAADTWQLVCSGALVNQRSVVVAAHCVTELGKLYPLDTAKVRVVLGKQYRSDSRETKGLQRLRISSITVHPNYDPLVLDSDLAILKLLDKARIGEHVLPICLPDAQDAGENSLSIRGMVTGWSLIPDPRARDSERARVGTVMLGDVVHCEQQYAQYGVPISVTENMLCGRQGAGASPSNICPAETGGVLILPPSTIPDPTSSLKPNPTQEWKLLGLVSFGYDSLDCNPELYTVYTHIANFIDFLDGNMK